MFCKKDINTGALYEPMKKAVMIIAQEGFRDEELLVPKEILETGGVEVNIASQHKGEAKGKLGAKVNADISYKDINVEDYGAIVLVGGPGCKIYFEDADIHKILKEADAKGKVIAAICSSAATLAFCGILKGKKATSFPLEAGILKQKGAIYTGKPLERDGEIITANGPGVAETFGKEILHALL
jgi:protease I